MKLGTEIAFVEAEERIFEGGKKIALRFTIRKRSAEANGIYGHESRLPAGRQGHSRDVGNDLHNVGNDLHTKRELIQEKREI